jgi:L-lysine exporter family protein LysE/ArgO
MLSFFPTAFLSGFGTSMGLIVAIGAQNAFVLKQGILRNHVFTIALICSLLDAMLIVFGVAGFGVILTSSETLINITRYGGAIFLLWYGFRSFRAAFSKNVLVVDDSKNKPSFKKTILTLLALTLLNPHVYLDTCVLVGSIGIQFPLEQRVSFTVGAALASFTWFFTITYAAKFLVPFFRKPRSWKILDTTTGLIMWSIAALLLFKL